VGRDTTDEGVPVLSLRRLLIAILVVAVLPASALAETDSLQSRLKAAQEEKERTEERIRELRGEEGDARSRLAAVDAELAREEASLALLRVEMEQAEESLAEAQQRVAAARERLVEVNAVLEVAEADLSEKRSRLESRIRAAYKYGHVSFAEVFAEVRDFADFVNTTQYVGHVLNGDRDLVQSVSESLAEVERQRNEARLLREEAEEQEALAVAYATQIEDALVEQRRLAESVRANRRARADALEDLRTDRAAAEGHLAGLEAEAARIQAQLVEIARRQAQEAYEKALEKWKKEVKEWEACQERNAKLLAEHEAGTGTGSGDGNGDGSGDGSGEGGDGSGDPLGEPELEDCGKKPPSSPPKPPPSIDAGTWVRPVPGYVSSPFGPRWGRMHYGVDLANNMGTSIRSAQAGEVVWRVTGCNPTSSWGCGGGFGNYVVIDHGGGFATVYAHMQNVGVSTGQKVSRGATIGTVGNSGNSYGSHLHFEFYDGGVRKNPCNYISC
jgi:murein DD-endopeptidase MepM/ murein hydrolase activator NlpD